MAKPTTGQVKARFETDLSDAALDLLIDAADAEVTSRFGPHASQVDTLRGGEKVLYLLRPASTITAVIETVSSTDTTLAADDYEIRNNGWRLERLNNGTNGRERWGGEVKVTYVALSDARRVQVAIDLVILAAQYNGLASQGVGDSRSTSANYREQKNDILRTLETRQRMIA